MKAHFTRNYHAFQTARELEQAEVDMRSDCGLRSKTRTWVHRGRLNTSLCNMYTCCCQDTLSVRLPQILPLLVLWSSLRAGLAPLNRGTSGYHLCGKCSNLTEAQNWKPVFQAQAASRESPLTNVEARLWRLTGKGNFQGEEIDWIREEILKSKPEWPLQQQAILFVHVRMGVKPRAL